MTSVLLYLLVFTGGVLTILSPCILPVLPFVFARSGRSFRRDSVPMLLGLGISFATVATAATIGAGWAARAADGGRWLALIVLGLAGTSLLAPRVTAWLAHPIVRLGATLATKSQASTHRPHQVASYRTSTGGDVARAFTIGLATGMLWAPCAGPILGLVFTAAISSTSSTMAASLFATFALGAALSLAVALGASTRVLAWLRRMLAGDLWIRRTLGTLALAGVGLIALGLDARLFSGGGVVQTAAAEERLIRTLAPNGVPSPSVVTASRAMPSQPPVPTADLGAMPSLSGGGVWLNSLPLTTESLRGKVVFVDFWTFECYNCLNALPYVKALHAKYAAKGLVVIGVHTPEFPRERVKDNVIAAMDRLGVKYPVVTDNGFAIWKSFGNRYWPSAYIVDRNGRIRYHWDGEGHYDEQERVVQQLLAEGGL